MGPVKRPRDSLAEIWKWLPAFRSAAELQSMSRAAQALGLTPSAVSRAVAKIEDTLGQRLFVREKGRLSLNDPGAALLRSLTEASLELSRTVGALERREVAGTVRVSSIGQLASSILLATAGRLAKELPRVRLEISHVEPEVAIPALERRTLDLYLALNIAVGEPLVTLQLAELGLSIYCGRGHPLFLGPLPPVAALLQHGFVVGAPSGLMKPAWPKGLERKISLRTGPNPLALDACLGGGHLAVLDEVTARPHLEAGSLRELPVIALGKASLMLCQRRDADQRLLRQVSETIATTARETCSSVRRVPSRRGSA